MRKRKMILICALLIMLLSGFLCYWNFFDTAGFVYWTEADGAAFFSNDSYHYYIVSETGNCYLAGPMKDENNNYGLENVRKYKNAPANNFVRIYDKGNAEKMHLNRYGGTIATKDNDIYIFVNGNETYRTPTFFASGYCDAFLGEDKKIYLLKENGDLGFVTLDNTDDFHFIKNQVKKLNYVMMKDESFLVALTNNHQLYSLNADDITNQSEGCAENVSDFDIIQPSSDQCILSIVDTDGNAYSATRTHSLHIENLSAFDKHHNQNIISAASYQTGIAMLDENGNVFLSGTEVRDSTEVFEGDLVFTDVKAVFGGVNSLAVIKKDGEFMLFGLYPDLSARKYAEDYLDS